MIYFTYKQLNNHLNEGRKMRKSYMLEDLDCANCAAKIERAIREIDGVIYAGVSFMTQKLTLETEDAVHEKILDEVEKTILKLEPDVTLVR